MFWTEYLWVLWNILELNIIFFDVINTVYKYKCLTKCLLSALSFCLWYDSMDVFSVVLLLFLFETCDWLL